VNIDNKKKFWHHPSIVSLLFGAGSGIRPHLSEQLRIRYRANHIGHHFHEFTLKQIRNWRISNEKYFLSFRSNQSHTIVTSKFIISRVFHIINLSHQFCIKEIQHWQTSNQKKFLLFLRINHNSSSCSFIDSGFESVIHFPQFHSESLQNWLTPTQSHFPMPLSNRSKICVMFKWSVYLIQSPQIRGNEVSSVVQAHMRATGQARVYLWK
jgi:hypothetical protein